MDQTFTDRDGLMAEYRTLAFEDASRDAELFLDKEASDPFVCQQGFCSESFISAAREHYLRALSHVPKGIITQDMCEGLAYTYACALKSILRDAS